MKALRSLNALQRNLLLVLLPVLAWVVLLASSWQTSLAEQVWPVTGMALVSAALLVLALTLAIALGRNGDAENVERLQRSLEVCQANVMIADNDFNIRYMNQSVWNMLRRNESRLRQALPRFDLMTLIGTNVDVFHQNPAHQRRLVQGLTGPYKTDLKLNGMTFGLIATPILSANGHRLGTVVEWYDKTEELALRDAEQQQARANARIAHALKICDTSVMMADNDFNIVYMNDAVRAMMAEASTELRKAIPAFDHQRLLGSSIDLFHKNPAMQRRMLQELKLPYHTDIKVGSLTFGLIATPVLDEAGMRLGTVVEWKNKTAELAAAERERRLSEENQRVRQALDNVSTNAMIADRDGNIVYTNKAVVSMMKVAEQDIRKDLPQFDAGKLMGVNFDSFHKNPAHQRNLLDKLRDTYRAQISVGGRHFSLVANPVLNDKGERIGSVVEWADRTAEVRVEKEIAALVSAAGQGDLTRRLPTEDKTGFMLNLAEGLNTLMAVCEEVVSDTIRVFDALAHGNLNERITRHYQGSFEKLKRDANATVDRLIEIITGIVEAANAVSNGADEIAQGNSDLSQRTEEQASSLEETASSMEEMTSAVKQSSDNAREASALAADARQRAAGGGAVVARAVEAMGAIEQSSKKIADIIGVIDGIAFQTNLLALNAAVEAARAGEQGRGFAVVAGEVRSLAQRSAAAAREIKDLIRDSVAKVADGTRLVNESGETLRGIVESVQKVSTMIHDISSAAQEQTSGIEQVNVAISQMDEMTQQNAALVEEASAAGETLSDQARQLMSMMSFFSIENVARPGVKGLSEVRSPAMPARKAVAAASPSRRPAASHGEEWEEF